MKVTLMSAPLTPDSLCGEAAALCTGSKHPALALRGAMDSGHESVAEHAAFTFRIEGVSRVLLAQLTRHRLASFSVQSQRYCGVKPEWIVPQTVKDKGFEKAFLAQCETAYNLFSTMCVSGEVEPEDARYIIPQCVTCNLIVTMNARELRHFFSLRMCNRAQWEIRELADKMFKICKGSAPMLFRNSGPGCMTSKGCPEKKPCGEPRTAEDVR